MGDFGVKVSQVGKDVVRAGDQDLLFSSAWPTPKILFNGRIKTVLQGVEPAVSSGVLLKHKLGYVPFFIPYIFSSSAGTLRIFRQLVSADKQNIYISAPGGSGAGELSVDVGLLIFALDLEKSYKAPNIDVGKSSASRGDKNVGIRLTKPHKDVSSTDLRDYIIHSRTRSPLIHEVVNGLPTEPGSTAVLKNFVYQHNLPYNPMFFAYMQAISSGLGPEGAYGLINGFAGLAASGDTIRVTNQNVSGRVSIVTLKDPFVIDDSTTRMTA